MGPIELTRAIRICTWPHQGAGSDAAQPGSDLTTGENTFAGAPAMEGVGAYDELVVTARGTVDPSTGYFLNIQDIDHAVRVPGVAGFLARVRAEGRGASPLRAVLELAATVGGSLRSSTGAGLTGLRWRLTPFFSVEALMKQDRASSVLMRQQFDFAAAHRLHAPNLSDEENRRVFGKCNNPRGHGHNYRIEVCVRVTAAAAAAPTPPLTLAQVEEIVSRTVVRRFDHKHLNEDTREFNPAAGGLNPSVENIARVCFELLEPEFAAALRGSGGLDHVTVWETEKTAASYPAPERA